MVPRAGLEPAQPYSRGILKTSTLFYKTISYDKSKHCNC
ncbi:hypothetical protein XBKQ1_2360065 [Xenorhabdus bovienii str. kraussei Quebec]|uniref:Uncharacterized protein n=1 Tax=Xenorhabdus bovienii str. kraussei Quebec TaxID=1398203 RepID=A0A077PH18_XENBV|nr:hypothetical protein XBKQ1_2360065 [Xenorhabdus bovienii str. kraussei Quebec]